MRVFRVRAQQALEQLRIEDVDAHRGERHVRPARDRLRVHGLLLEAQDAVRLVHGQHAEFAGAIARHFHHAHGDVGFLLDVKADHRTVVHLVDVVAREHQHVQRTVRAEDLHVLPQGVGRALVPLGPKPLLRRNDLDELAELAAEVTPAALDVLDQRMRLVLRQHRDLADAGIHAIREHEVDDAELAAERGGGLAAILGQVLEPLAAATGHDDGHSAARESTQVTTGCKQPVLFCGHPAPDSGSSRHAGCYRVRVTADT